MPTAARPLPAVTARPVRPGWPLDITVLAALALLAWVLMIAGSTIDLDVMVARNLHSEADLWVFGLVLAPVYLFAKWVAGSWGTVVVLLTGLLVTTLAVRRRRPAVRWAIAGPLTATVMIAVPMLLNRAEGGRLERRYGGAVAPPPTGGRAIELAGATPIPSTWQRLPDCRGQCLDLLTFGGARTVTLSFPGIEGRDAEGRWAETYRIGPIDGGCAGASFKRVCPHLVTTGVPADRLIVTLAAIRSRPGDAVAGRQLIVRDTRRPAAPPVRLTRLMFRRYPSLLNIAWRDGGLILPRGALPPMAADRLEHALYRDLIDNRVWEGGYYPFR